jgi:hypothetical protein
MNRVSSTAFWSPEGRKMSDSTDRERVKYGFDRASNRVWRESTVASGGQDEFYTYDGLYEVKTLDRGMCVVLTTQML